MTEFSTLSDKAWLGLICESYLKPNSEGLVSRLPAFPPDSLQEGTTGLYGEATLRQAFAFYCVVCEALGHAGFVPGPSSRLLDFGVGWGRIARFFLREFPAQGIYGIDVDPDLVKVAQECFPSGNFSACSPFPPTKFASGSFDSIVAYSVFSHLSEHAALAWLEEFARLLKSGGIAVLTTRHISFLDFCEGLKGRASSDYEKGLLSMFDSFDEARRRFDGGEFLHSAVQGVAGSGAREGGYYGETFIPEAYVRRIFSRWFVVKSFRFPVPGIDQAVIELQKA